MTNKKNQTSVYTGKIILKIAVTCSLSWEIGKLLGSAHPYLAPLSVILCMKSTLTQSLHFAMNRMVGTVIGVAFTAIVLIFFPKPNALILGLLIFAGLWIAKGLRRNQIVSEQLAITILLVLVFEPKSGNYIVDRLRDTSVGILLAVIIQLYVFPANYKKEIKKMIIPFTNQLSELFRRTAGWVHRGCHKDEGERLTQEIKHFLEMSQNTDKSLMEMNKNMKYYPLSAQKYRTITGYQKQLNSWRDAIMYLECTVKTVGKWSTTGLMSNMDRKNCSKQLKEIGEFFHHQAETLEAIRGEMAIEPFNMYVKPIFLHICLPEQINSPPFNIVFYQDTLDLVRSLNEINKL